MPTRLTAFLLILVLLWSAFSTHERPGPLVSAGHGLAQVDALVVPPPDLAPGSVAHHHLDDQPSQSQADPLSESPGLLPPPLATRGGAAVLSRRHRFVMAAARAPCLEGPLRPPCAAGPAA